MANVLNPEPESITLNSQLETPTIDPATELEQPLHESTSNFENTEALVSSATPMPQPSMQQNLKRQKLALQKPILLPHRRLTNQPSTHTILLMIFPRLLKPLSANRPPKRPLSKPTATR